MKRVRVIPVLGLEDGSLVKTINFKNPNYLGDPINAIKIYNDKEVDEIAVVDIRASQQGKEPNYTLINEMAGECFMPMSYGGGIKTFDSAKKVFDQGVEKLIFNTSCIESRSLLTDVAKLFGEQSTVASIDIKKSWLGKKGAVVLSGTKSVKKDLASFAKELVESGVGEIVVNSVVRDGSFNGYDLDAIKVISEAVSVPVIALGGARNISDFVAAVKEGKASAVAASSMFAYKNQDTNSILINYPSQEELISNFYNKI